MLSALTEALVRRGHAVTLFCAPGSVSSAKVVTLLDASHADEIERSLYEADHVARAFNEIDLAADDNRPEKGPHRAIAAAHAADVPLVLAGVIQPGQQAFFDREVAPHIDGDRVRFVGEVGGPVKRSLCARASGLLMPIRWDEPFGMVMIEALACGTPVIAFPEGAARELVIDGVTGFLVDDERAMAATVGRLPSIAPRDCRAWVAEHCDVDAVAAAYERTYRSVAHPLGASVSLALLSAL